ncbi:MAG: CZB domain-containing protein [Candidatus Binataceae bacterium]|jgi:methyl-accepting chemotaxis protein
MADTQNAITAAIGAHGMWKARLKSAIDKGTSEFTQARVHADNQCDFGKWLYGSAAELKSSQHYGKCLELHRQFHAVAAKVLSLALAGKKEEALKAMAVQGEFAVASATLTNAMTQWKNAG